MLSVLVIMCGSLNRCLNTANSMRLVPIDVIFKRGINIFKTFSECKMDHDSICMPVQLEKYNWSGSVLIH